MEYGLRVKVSSVETVVGLKKVLILVLMEYGLRALLEEIHKSETLSS